MKATPTHSPIENVSQPPNQEEESLEESPLPPLPKEREANQPALIAFFMKTPTTITRKREEKAASIGENNDIRNEVEEDSQAKESSPKVSEKASTKAKTKVKRSSKKKT